MVLVGFTWFVERGHRDQQPLGRSRVGLLFGDLFLAVFVHLLVAYPTGRLDDPIRARSSSERLHRARSSRARSSCLQSDPKPVLHEVPARTRWRSGAPHGIANALTVVVRPDRSRDHDRDGRDPGTAAPRGERRGAPGPRSGPHLRGDQPALPRGSASPSSPVSKAASTRRVLRRSHRVRHGAASSSSPACSGSASRARPRASCCRRSPRRRRSRRRRTACAGRCTIPLSSSRGGCRRAAGYVDREGHPFTPTEAPGRAITTVEHEGLPLAVVVHDAALLDEPELLNGVLAAARLALVKDRLQAELLARLVELQRQRDYIAVLVNARADVLLRDRPRGKDRSLQRHADRRERDARRRGGARQALLGGLRRRRGRRRAPGAAILSAAPGEHEHRWRAERRRVDRRRLVADPGRRRRRA